ncbi:MAG: L-threonylcarbamoyladenylate synthase [Anaerolineaceae bacterium]
METLVIKTGQKEALPLSLETLRMGNLVAFPTDTVYGLAADPFNISAIIKLFESKGREYNKAIAILVGSMEQVKLITENFTEVAQKLTKKFWPGGLTVIVPKRKDIPDLLSSNQSIGIRMPNHPLALELLQQFGPLATTSANLSSGPNPLNAAVVFTQLNTRIPLILDGGNCPGGIPSTVVDCTIEELHILRTGPISEQNLRDALSEIS